MLNQLEIQLEFYGNWHIGVSVDNIFVKYFKNENIVIDLEKIPTNIDIMFLGKDYNTDPDSYCKIKNIYFNNLLLNDLTSTFSTENTDYPIIDKCDVININGMYKIFINDAIIKDQLEKILND